MPSSAAFGPPLSQPPNYSRREVGEPFFKGSPVDREIERKAKRAKVKTHERKEKQAARKVLPGCRWPKFDHESKRHVCVGQLEAAHGKAIGMGGDRDGSRTDRLDLLVVCSLIHLGDNGIERHARKWKPLDKKRGSAGPVAFYRREPLEGRRGEWGPWKLIAVESSPGILDEAGR